MGLPVAPGDLVADQRVTGGIIGDAQQCFGQAHQRHAFLAGQRIFLHQPLDPAAPALAAQRGHEGAGGRGDGIAQLGGKFGLEQQIGQAIGFGAAIRGGYPAAQGGWFTDGGGYSGKGPVGHAGLLRGRILPIAQIFAAIDPKMQI